MPGTDRWYSRTKLLAHQERVPATLDIEHEKKLCERVEGVACGKDLNLSD